jgi:hypothetical protein
MVLEDVFNLLRERLKAEPLVYDYQVNNWRPGGGTKQKKLRTNLEGANYMFGGDSLLRILFTDLVCFRGDEMYEF